MTAKLQSCEGQALTKIPLTCVRQLTNKLNGRKIKEILLTPQLVSTSNNELREKLSKTWDLSDGQNRRKFDFEEGMVI